MRTLTVVAATSLGLIQSGQFLLGPDEPAHYGETTPLTASRHWDQLGEN